jgi:plastocyanin
MTLAAILLNTGFIQANAATVEIAVKDFAFQPASAQAKAGDTIRWRNMDPAPHTATADGVFDVSVPVGGSGETVVNQPGSTEYHCTLHPDMKARIVVAPR